MGQQGSVGGSGSAGQRTGQVSVHGVNRAENMVGRRVYRFQHSRGQGSAGWRTGDSGAEDRDRLSKGKGPSGRRTGFRRALYRGSVGLCIGVSRVEGGRSVGKRTVGQQGEDKGQQGSVQGVSRA